MYTVGYPCGRDAERDLRCQLVDRQILVLWLCEDAEAEKRRVARRRAPCAAGVPGGVLQTVTEESARPPPERGGAPPEEFFSGFINLL